LIALLGAAPTGSTLQGGAARAIGSAREQRGNWSLQGGATSVAINPGDRLPPGAIVLPPKESADAFLKVVYRDGQSVRFQCPRDCAGPVRLKTAVAPTPTSWTNRWDVVERLFWGNLERYRDTLTRGDSVDRDLVVRLDAACSDITAAFAGVRHGAYDLRLKPSTAGGVDDDRRFTDREFEWDGRACLRPSPPVTPGLYEVSVIYRGGDAEAVSPFWALVLPPDRFGNAAAAYDDAKSVLKDADVSDRKAMLRAFIDQLARESFR
jgi:hypothetical protein